MPSSAFARKFACSAPTSSCSFEPTNVCITDCGFCAFYRSPADPESYVLSREEIFKKVEDMSITPKQAEAMLAAVGDSLGRKVPMTPKAVVEEMGDFIVKMEKKGGAAFRKVKSAELLVKLKGADVNKRLELINNALNQSHISGDTLVKLRRGALTLPPGATGDMKVSLKAWAKQAFARRAINSIEKKYVESQVGPLD